MSDLLTAQQVADLIGVASQTVRTWARRGDIPFTHDAYGWRRFRAEDVYARLDTVEATVSPFTQLDRLANMPAPAIGAFDLDDTGEL